MFYISLLKPFHDEGDRQDTPLPILVDGKLEYKVDLLVGHWINREIQ